MVDQSYSERQLLKKHMKEYFQNFKSFLICLMKIFKKLNKALKRNLENQTGSATTQSKKVQVEQTENNGMSVEQMI